MEDVKAIIRELLEYDDVINALYNSDMEESKEYTFDAETAIAILKEFAAD